LSVGDELGEELVLAVLLEGLLDQGDGARPHVLLGVLKVNELESKPRELKGPCQPLIYKRPRKEVIVPRDQNCTLPNVVENHFDMWAKIAMIVGDKQLASLFFGELLYREVFEKRQSRGCRFVAGWESAETGKGRKGRFDRRPNTSSMYIRRNSVN
jgi:hypothetical protein